MYATQYSAMSSGPNTTSIQSPLLPEPTITGRYNNQWEGHSRHLPHHHGNKPNTGTVTESTRLLWLYYEWTWTDISL